MPAYIKSETHITIVFDSGKQGTMFNSNDSFKLLTEAIKQDQWGTAYDLLFPVEQVKEAISQLDNERVVVEGGYVLFDGVPIHNTLTDRMLQMHQSGFNITHMSVFLENMMYNPSHRAVTELYSFLEASKLPITDDGHFLAYKRIGNDYKDLYSRSVDNSVGEIVEMPRNQVNDNKDETCSQGLHFCAREYLSSYGTGNNSRVVMLKINPRDVVSIPTDYNNAKGRCCRYEVFQEMDIDDEQQYRLPTEKLEGLYKDTKSPISESEQSVLDDAVNNAYASIVKELAGDVNNVDDVLLQDIIASIIYGYPTLEDTLLINSVDLSDKNVTQDEPLPESSLPKEPKKVPHSTIIQKLSPITSGGNYIVLETFSSAINAMNSTGIDSSSIIKVCNGTRKSAGGFKWRWKTAEAPVGSLRAGYTRIDIDDASREDRDS